MFRNTLLSTRVDCRAFWDFTSFYLQSFDQSAITLTHNCFNDFGKFSHNTPNIHFYLEKKITRSVEIPPLGVAQRLWECGPVFHYVADRAERTPRKGCTVTIYSCPLPRGDRFINLPCTIAGILDSLLTPSTTNPISARAKRTATTKTTR